MFDCPGAHLNQTTRNSLLRGGTGQHEPLKTDTETCAASRARVMTTVTHKKTKGHSPQQTKCHSHLSEKFLQLHDKRSKSASAQNRHGRPKEIGHPQTKGPIWREIFRHREGFQSPLLDKFPCAGDALKAISPPNDRGCDTEQKITCNDLSIDVKQSEGWTNITPAEEPQKIGSRLLLVQLFLIA